MVRHRYELTIGVLSNAVRRDQEEGRISNTREPRGIAESLVAVWNGLQRQWLIDPQRDPVAAMTAALRDLLGPRALPNA